MSDRAERARTVLSDLLTRSGFVAEIEATETEDQIRLDVQPSEVDDIQLLVGRQGRTLAAYQFILNRMVNRFPEDRKPVSLDVSGFAEQRKDRLRGMAKRLAGTSRDSNIQVRMRGMNPADRRVVHLALEDEDGIHTFSENEGIARELILTTMAHNDDE